MNIHNSKNNMLNIKVELASKKTLVYTFLCILIIVCLSGFYLRLTWNKYQKAVSSEALILAQSLESLLHPNYIEALSGNSSDLEKPEYIMIKNSMQKLVKATKPIHFVYIMAERNGKIVILLDSESPDSENYSPPGQVYDEADFSYLSSLMKGEAVITKPIADRWGTWVSALVPINNPNNDNMIAVLGIDYSAFEWYARLWKLMLPDIIIVLCAFMLFLILLRYRAQHTVLKNMSKQLSFDEALYRSVFNEAPIGIAIVNGKNFISQSEFGNMNINPMFEKILGRKSFELETVQWPDITHPDDLEADLEKFEQFKKGEIPGYSMEKRFIRPDGSIVWTNMIISAFLGGGDNHSMHLCLLEDITARKETEESYKESERSKSVLLSHLPGLAYRCKYDRDWTMQFVSEGCLELTGYPPESLLYNRDLSYNELISPEYHELLWREWEYTLQRRIPFKYEYEIITATGERKWVLELGQGIFNDKGEVEALEGIILDISNRKEMENVLKFNSEHDTWTGLYNRKYLHQVLEQDFKGDILEKSALVGINLSPIHLLSLKYGFQYSQEIIKKIAEALKLYCNDTHMLFNTYEYRFAFYVKGYKNKLQLISFCKSIASMLSSILSAERISGGIGVIEIDDKNTDIELLLKNLLIASEKAINNYETSFEICFFGEEMAEQIIREDMISRELSQIIANEKSDRLFLQYQPILDLDTNTICGFEALARLNSEHFGSISPIEFIPIAEKNRLIIALGDVILYKALCFLKKLSENGFDNINVSVNVSAIQLWKNDFAEKVIDMVKSMQVNPTNVGIEITESIFASNYQEINKTLGKLKDFGIKIAIDDFGTGYSSLARERELNVNCLKIDKSFIGKLSTIDPDYAITRDIISMAHKLGHSVIAEGIEFDTQKQYLEMFGCDKIQGFLIGKPMDEELALELLKKHNNLDAYGSGADTADGKQTNTKMDLETQKDQLQLILDSTAEAIYGVDLNGNCTFCNLSCIRLLGYEKPEDLLGKNMHIQIHHSRQDGTPIPPGQCKISEAMRLAKGVEAKDDVFWKADGTAFNVEYRAFPQIKNGKVIGAVVTFSDITEQKRKEEEIRYLSCHDTLTGLYNRRCFEENREKIDTPENLPLSIIFADINGLKMTNDIFGHAAGDELIKKSAQILINSCRKNDIIARTGGDEFVILLPKTDAENAKKILKQIKNGFSDARVEAIKCSIALGCDTKTSIEQPLEEIMANAENAMYKDKTINRKTVNKNIIDTIVDTLHTRSPKEKQHSITVSDLCGKVGKALGLPPTEISKLKRAGYLHDIGKIILDKDTLIKSKENLNEEEYEKMQQHSVVGYRILNLFDDTLDLAEYVYGHHENWDGSGYPRGLKGDQIPLISRIISVVEVYERELVKRALPIEVRKRQATEKIKEGMNTRFDPKIAQIMIDMMED